MNKNFVLKFLGAIALLSTLLFFGNLTSKHNSNVLGDTSSFSSLTLDQFNKALNSGKYALIDVRTLDEYNSGHLKNAKQADYYQTQQFSDYLDSLNKDSNYLIYCRSGGRSSKVMQIMQDKGFVNVYGMSGGYNAWITSGFSVEK
jgi:rhodanese-related sulfurtransferase